MKQTTRLAATVAAFALALTGCGTSSGDDSDNDGSSSSEEQGGFTAPDVPMADQVGEFEDSLSVLAWPGYAEDVSTD